MAKFSFKSLMAETGEFEDVYRGIDQMDQESFNDGAVSYDDVDGLARISLIGSDIECTWDWTVTSGHITSATFWYNWQTAISVKGLDLDAAALDAIVKSNGAWALMDRLMRGNDRVIGSDAADHLFGGRGNDIIKGGDGADQFNCDRGNDRLTGGAGSDEFFFSSGQGKDVITDFDARGGGRRQDYIQVTGEDPFTIHARGHDTVIDFGHGSTVTLLGVDRSDFTRAGDIHYVEF